MNGDLQTEVPASLPSLGGEGLTSTSTPQDPGSMKYSHSAIDIDKLFDNITYVSPSIGIPEERYSPKRHSARDDHNLDLLSKYPTYVQNNRIASTDVGSEISTNMGYLYQRATKEDTFSERSNELQRDIASNLHNIYAEDKSEDRIRIADKDAAVENPVYRYYFEKKPDNEMSSPFSSVDYDINSNFDYIYKNNYAAPQREIAASAITEARAANSASSEQVQLPELLLSMMPNLKYVCESSTAKTAQTETSGTDVSDIESVTNSNLNRLIQDNAGATIIPYLTAAGLVNPAQIPNLDRLDGKARSLKNYAVVVGINNYTDRSSLHTSVNDAETMTALLESYGYDVVKLTDITDEKPTKSNILEKALGEMKYKKDLGKVLIYFSGHGEKRDNDYYLIPQDGNGHTSSYISTEELEKSIQGLKSVALVVDACNSGGLENVVENGQMILVSSKEDQPSNEVWFGSLSLFTYNLCKAMREEDKSSNAVVLQRCFYKAREATEKWTNWRLLAQTPQMKDKTVGYFSLK
ncbi:MAG: caspase family protein [Methanothrix sp.]|nr:caspase family protein [Methanothrix sp.]